MGYIDWAVLVLSQLVIIIYGVWKNKGNENLKSYLLNNRNTKWFTVGISIMATQASAITFLSAPGLAYTEGMQFIQLYLGLPIAVVILCLTIVPIYHKLGVYTAYEFLEKRFNASIRTLAAFLFLTQRGVAAGLTIFAPSLILSSILGWNIYFTTIGIGIVVIIYTVIGGAKAVNRTQRIQLGIIWVGILITGYVAYDKVTFEMPLDSALHVAGKMGKLNVLNFNFDWNENYNIWSGTIGGLFLMLSYFGTDQSQVQRYLMARSVGQSRLGLLFNGMAKIPMQFIILFIGVLIYIFYIFHSPPLFFNAGNQQTVIENGFAQELEVLESQFNTQNENRRKEALNLVDALDAGDQNQVVLIQDKLNLADKEITQTRNLANDLVKKANPESDINESNYVFLYFILEFLPIGFIGLLISVVISASMSSTSAVLSALASTTVIDIYKKPVADKENDKQYLLMSKWFTVIWGVYAILFALFANRLGTLVEAINVIGSLVYGTILGIFLVAFFLKSVQAKATMTAALVAELAVLICYFHPEIEISYLWYNLIGCIPVILIAYILQKTVFNSSREVSVDSVPENKEKLQSIED
ncbi:sodium:solute symporter [Flexithrix dorotheae]|uniref:sodium:solute symporter n=1 Tax=Flexithrix dorotheae TaxID=70993 RepID=UPI0003668E0E|nr:sodium:solute symporter [Flexithrix dorotheae]